LSRLRTVTGCVTETPTKRRHPEPRTGTLPVRVSMCSKSIGRLDRAVTRLIRSRSHRMAYPRHRIWLQRQRGRPAIQLKNQRLIQLFQRANVPVNPGKLKRRTRPRPQVGRLTLRV